MGDLKKVLVAGEIMVHSEAADNLAILCDRFGSRFFATPEARSACKFMAKKFQEYGLMNIQIEPAKYFGWKNGKLAKLWSWKRETASFDLLEPIKRELECISLANAPSTPSEGICAELFNLESGSRDYLFNNREKIRGKLILDGNYTKLGAYMGSGDPVNLYRITMYGYLVQFGAVGMIFINRNYGNLCPTGAVRFGSIGEIPAIGISRETSDYILRQIRKGPLKANLKVNNTYAPGAIAYNVIAELPGTKYPKNVILVGGHYDGHDISPGAMDDAAGTCVLMEAARALAKHGGPFKRTIRFISFAGEELGLIGSTGYVINHLQDLEHIDLMINTDASGISAKTGHSFIVRGPSELVSYLEKVVNKLGKFDRHFELPKIQEKSGRTSDYLPFYMHGIPAACLRDVPVDPRDLLYSHTSGDTIDKVDPKALKDAAVILALTVIHVANDETYSIQHTPVSEMLEILQRTGVADYLQVENRWHREVPD